MFLRVFCRLGYRVLCGPPSPLGLWYYSIKVTRTEASATSLYRVPPSSGMEALRYEHGIEDAGLRMARLRCACAAFLAEPTTRRDVHCVALMVDVPTLARTEIPAGTVQLVLGGGASTGTAAGDGGRRGATPAVPTPPDKRTAKSQRIAERLEQRRRIKELAAQRCSKEAESRLWQAHKDAHALSTWLKHYYFGGPNRTTKSSQKSKRSNFSDVRVIVMAYLTPTNLSDLALYRSWQYGLEAKRYSPLRYAALVCVSLGAELSFTTDWLSHPSHHIDGAALIQPHQTLLLDLSWCLEGMGQERHHRPHHRRAPSAAGLDPSTQLHTFLDELQMKVKLPKDSRIACWLAYHGWLHRCQENGRDDHGDVDDGGARWSIGALCQGMQTLYHRLHASPGVLGRTTSWKLITSFGGTVDALVSQASIPTASPQGGSSDEAALLLTRGQQDLYALLGYITQSDAAGSFREAVSFCRRVQRRLETAQWMGLPSASLALTAVDTNMPARPRKATGGSPNMAGSSPPSASSIFFGQAAAALMARERRLRAKRPRVDNTTRRRGSRRAEECRHAELPVAEADIVKALEWVVDT